MAENSRAVFIVATANEMERLPPELIRKGRLDEIFFVDLPGPEVRSAVYEVHLEKRGHNHIKFELIPWWQRPQVSLPRLSKPSSLPRTARGSEEPLETRDILKKHAPPGPLSGDGRENRRLATLGPSANSSADWDTYAQLVHCH